MNDARQDPTTPSPRNAPPVTDRERLRKKLRERATANMERTILPLLSVNDVLAILDGATVTLPPEPPAEDPMVSEAAWEAFVDGIRGRGPNKAWFALCGPEDIRWLRQAMYAILPDLARDHGLLTPEEVERRAREWARGWFAFDRPEYQEHIANKLISALTRRGAGGK